VNWGRVLGDILKLDFTVVVPSEGPIVSRSDLEAYKAKLDTFTARAMALANSGVPKSELMAQLDTSDLGWRFDVSGDHLDRFYTELTQNGPSR
jgi:hypothetical protein